MLKQKKSKLVLGVTGSIGSGKSTVARMFKHKDCQLIDADCLGHGLMSIGTGVYRKIIKSFGRGILKPDNSIDRAKLARIAFANQAALTRLNNIVHQAVIAEIKRRIKSSGKKAIILDAALIIEAGLRKMVDKLVVVKASRQQQILRSQKRLALSKNEISRRIKYQISQNAKLRLADFIIDNSGKISKTRKQVSEIRRKLWRN
ncbi:MAG: dephospho-CoA kinase [Candidatus Omnitrophica bacterium]|nr:dephospho-CoA kinase [Candidatus Omnitrophota bacterium]MBU1922748.1 dephospho-CoA kinase [Candidatus Omnitrophota bacterium]